MDTLLWVIVAIIVLGSFLMIARKRKKAGASKGAKFAAPDAKGHGTDLQAVRKLHDDMT